MKKSLIIVAILLLIGAGFMYYKKGFNIQTSNNVPKHMTNEEAKKYVTAYGKKIGDNVSLKEDQQDFKVILGAAEFSYSANDGQFSVFGLVVNDAHLMIKRKEFFDEVKRAGDREPSTLGEGYFYINEQPLNSGMPQLVLRKDFKDATLSEDRFVKEVDWLMEWATYWRKQRYLEVSGKSEEDLIKEAPQIEARAKRERPRPW
ncbi:MAG: hypothetical protein JWN37_91 [Candidatus Nomurabacteria bacterium]|nr:hypothetical protein [Candidatus Nomurabacteria bacterium]